MSTETHQKTLLLCYGNPGRLDDGLGPAFGQEIEKLAPPGVDVEVGYQLMAEDVKAAADHSVVVFVDAAVKGRAPFSLRPVRPRRGFSFSSHILKPEHVLALAEDLFGNSPQGYTLGILGYKFDDFGEHLSPGAQANLSLALQFMLPVLEQDSLAEASARPAGSSAAHDADKGE
jgi:hydrogenase maturation protease